jgi:hypothetical protein
MVIVVAPQHVQALRASLPEETFVIGELVVGNKQVTFR